MSIRNDGRPFQGRGGGGCDERPWVHVASLHVPTVIKRCPLRGREALTGGYTGLEKPKSHLALTVHSTLNLLLQVMQVLAYSRMALFRIRLSGLAVGIIKDSHKSIVHLFLAPFLVFWD